MNSTRVTGHTAAQALSEFLEDARGFVEDNFLLLLAVVALLIVVSWLTRPKVR